MKKNILGVSALYHDSAACLVCDGEIIAAAQEERFSRKKNDARFPVHAIEYCLDEGGITVDDLTGIAYYDNPLMTLERQLYTYFSSEEENNLLQNIESTFKRRIWIKKYFEQYFPSIREFPEERFYVLQHHISHAASAFLASPYNEAIILTIDGVGEWATLTIGVGEGCQIDLKEEIRYPHSLGLFYSALSFFCGFKVNFGEYKFMGLAPYGEPVYYEIIKNEIIDIKEDGSFRLNMDYFDYQNGRLMINDEHMSALFGGKRREPETDISEREMDIAASVQKITEEVIQKIVKYAKEKYGKNIDNLCLAGGVALNCVANGKILEKKIFNNIWIQPAAGDAGGALGAALYAYYQIFDEERKTDGFHDFQKGSYLGPSFSDDKILETFRKYGFKYHCPGNKAKLIAELLDAQKVVGFFSGRMEFGPRALGHRSILADPRSESMQAKLNVKIKFRESFRPFAPSVLAEDVSRYFEMNKMSPYMLFCANVKKDRICQYDLKKTLIENNNNMLAVINKKRSDIPAVTHVDYSARIQTVDGEFNSDFKDVLEAFKCLTGCPVLVNTSFNVRGEPIVCSPEDALKCFLRTEMDVLSIGSFILYKDEQNVTWEKMEECIEYELD